MAEGPAERRPKVVVLGLQALQPRALRRSMEGRSSLLRQRQEERAMTRLYLLRLTSCLKLLVAELTNGLQQAEPWLTLRSRILPQQALFEQSIQSAKDVKAPVGVDDGLNGLERCTAREDGQSPEQDLVLRDQQVIAPGDGVA